MHFYFSFLQVSCIPTKEFYTEMCSNWNASQFCGLVNSSVASKDRFDFTVGFDIFQDINVRHFMYNFAVFVRI